MIRQDPAEQLDPSFNIITPILIVIIFLIALILMRRANLSKNKANLLSVVSFLGIGLILGGRPNPVNAFNQIFANLIPSTSMSFRLLLSALGVFSLILASVILFSRIFCGYACPLGSMQELASKVNFKSNLKAQKKVKYSFDPPERSLRITRWIYLGILGLTALLLGFSVSQFLDPFNGFQFMEELALFTVIFLIMILITSFFIYRPWCRIFCPFGTISGLISFSQYRYVRTDECTDCGLCEKICPSHAADRGDKKTECYYCNRCVEICPQDAIKYAKATSTKN
ncbi:MAG: 4Fe-4S binding protein [Candidatus Heimdallarchaeota archaeon]|nr:MAG: 4Fe-4S binding protein [Candidatus Heimdallarchaeota archaeon]